MAPTGRVLSGCQIFDPGTVPAGWKCVPLGDRVELAYGSSLRAEDREAGDIEVYGSNGVVGRHRVALVDGPGVLVGRKGTVGAVHYANRSFWPIDTVYFVRPCAEDDMRFLRHLLDFLPLDILNAATGVPGLSRRDAYALRGVFPPIEEQAAIARVLDAVDSAIESGRENVKRAQILEQSVVEEAFCNLVAEPRCLGEFCTDVRYGTSKASNNDGRGNAVLRIPNVLEDRLFLDDLAYVDLPLPELERLRMDDGDLLLVRTNGNPNYVGRSVVFRQPDAQIWVYASYLIRVRMRSTLLPDYVNILLGIEQGRRELLRRVTTSAGNHNINSNSIRLIQLPVPVSPEAQTQIVELAKGCRSLTDSIKEKTEALENLKHSLMNDLLTGRVRVNEVLELPVQ